MADTSPESYGDPPPVHLTEATVRILATERIIKTAIIVVGSVGWVYYGIAVPVQATAGKETALSVVYQAIVDFDLHVVLSYAVAAVFFGLWRKERRTRITAVKRENRRNRELEKMLDPNRTSSGFEE